MAERPNQRRRTRKDLLEAAARLVREGARPSLDEVAEAALVSRATAYRYFPSVEALLAEAALHIAFPDPEVLLADAPQDPALRLERADAAMDEMIAANEASLRVMLARSLERGADHEVPKRQNRRTPLIEAALAPALAKMKRSDADMLTKALGILMGTEAMIAWKDVLQLDAAEARKVKRWAIRALVAAAMKP